MPGVGVVEYYTVLQSADTATILYSELLPKLDTLRVALLQLNNLLNAFSDVSIYSNRVINLSIIHP